MEVITVLVTVSIWMYVCISTHISDKCDKLTFICLIVLSCICFGFLFLSEGEAFSHSLMYFLLLSLCHLFQLSLYCSFPLFNLCTQDILPGLVLIPHARIYFCEVKASSAFSGSRCCHVFCSK